jgi:tRNA threonylcarbamoyladenosine biosynthesis protein TsaE
MLFLQKMQWSAELSDLPQVAEAIIAYALANKKMCIALHGEMGAGKTTFTAALCKALGVIEQTSSPTFSIVNEYYGSLQGQAITLAHMDWYRLRNEEDVYANGLDEYFTREHVFCIVEWPEKAAEALPVGCLQVSLIVHNEHTRVISVL